nr:hypothetical protein [Tanacetum cinerariifolium]
MRRVGKGFFGLDTPLFEWMLVPQQVDDDVAADVATADETDDVAGDIDLPSSGKGFFGLDTPLFEWMLVPQQVDDDVATADETDDVAGDVNEPTPPSPTPAITPPPSQEFPSISQPSHDATISMDLLNILLETCTTLTRKVEALKQDKIAQALEITRRMHPNMGDIAEIDTDKYVTLEEVTAEVDTAKDADDDEPELAELKEVIEVVTTAKLMIKVVTTAATTIIAAPITAATITTASSMRYDDIRPIFEKYFNSNVAFLEKGKEQLEEEASRALKRKSKSSKQQAAKKQKLDEEVEELKKHLQIVPNDEDDVYTEATPLALKVPVVDYQIHTENNKPYYKIIRADGTHQLFLRFLSLLRNFAREDLEMLWQ